VRRASWLIGSLLLLSFGCSKTMDVFSIRHPSSVPRPAKPAGCALEVHPESYRFPPECREVGDVFIGDNGWSYDCGWDRVRERVRDEACAFGADAAQIVNHYEPDFFGSTCHEVRARFMECGHAEAASK
jgi:hypothetical protein